MDKARKAEVLARYLSSAPTQTSSISSSSSIASATLLKLQHKTKKKKKKHQHQNHHHQLTIIDDDGFGHDTSSSYNNNDYADDETPVVDESAAAADQTSRFTAASWEVIRPGADVVGETAATRDGNDDGKYAGMDDSYGRLELGTPLFIAYIFWAPFIHSLSFFLLFLVVPRLVGLLENSYRQSKLSQWLW